jgi:hypothetical protein
MAGFGGRLLRVCVLTRKSKHEVNSALACFRGHHIRRSRVRKKNECDKRTVPVCCGPYESYPPARNKFIHSFHSLSARIRPRPHASDLTRHQRLPPFGVAQFSGLDPRRGEGTCTAIISSIFWVTLRHHSLLDYIAVMQDDAE